MLPDNEDAARIVARATQMDPKKRYTSAGQVREQIGRIRDHFPLLDTWLDKKISVYDPQSRRHRAEDCLAEKKYEQAGKLFTEAGSYRDAAERAEQCVYPNASELFEAGKYKNAAGEYALLAGRGDADAKCHEAKYLYCKEMAEKPDDDVYSWIAELVEAAYPDAAGLRDVIYTWHVSLHDEVSYSIGGMQATNITAYVQGGPPDGSVILTFEIIDSVTGQHTRWSGSDPVKRGGEESVYYSKDTLEYDLFDREHTVRVYGDDGSLLTTWTGKFKKSFDWEDSMRKED